MEKACFTNIYKTLCSAGISKGMEASNKQNLHPYEMKTYSLYGTSFQVAE